MGASERCDFNQIEKDTCELDILKLKSFKILDLDTLYLGLGL